MNRRSRLTFAVLAGASLLVGACGGSDDAEVVTPVESAAPAPETPATDPPADEPQATDTPATDPPATDPPEETVAAEANEASDIGVTEDTIHVGVAIADLAAIRAMGISIPETLTNEHLLERWTAIFDVWNEAGGINGRKIETLQLNWNPLDPSTFDTLCATATVDEELFMVVNGTGLSNVAMKCMSDEGMLMMYGDVVASELLDAGRFIALAPPADVVAAAGVDAWVAATEVAPGAKIGVLASNSPLASAAGAAAAEALTAAGYDPMVIETNSLGGDSAATVEEGGTAVGTFLAEGAVHAFVATPFTENGGFWTAAAGKLPYTLLDTASSQCSAFGLSRAPAGAAGGECATAYDHQAVEGVGVREDTAFEAECRAFNDELFTDYYGGPSNAGVPAGAVLTDAAGKKLISDFPPLECTIANIMHDALMNAGTNPTRDSVYEAALNLGEMPFALGSDGAGTLAPGKPYLADKVHTIRIAAATVETPAGPDGTYNGCPAPVNCGIVIGDWVAIK